jgi:hypothetical protein
MELNGEGACLPGHFASVADRGHVLGNLHHVDLELALREQRFDRLAFL